jgi:WD40 repeat protein
MTSLLEAHQPKPGAADGRGFEYFYFQNLAQGESEQVLYHATNAVLGVAISPDGKWLASRTTTETRLWDLASRNLVAAFASSVTNGDEFGLDPSEYNTSFSFDSQYLSIPTKTGLQLYQIPTRQIQSLSTKPVSWAGFSPTTNFIAFDENAIVTTNNARVWDYLADIEVHAPGLAGAFCWSPDGSHLFAGLWYSDVLDWDTATWSNPSTNSFDSNVSAAAVSPDGRLMAAAEWQGLVHLTELIGGKEIGVIASGDVRASALAFSPDGKLLATGSGTEAIQIWDLTTRQRIRQLRGHKGKVTSLAFSPDGRLLASSAMDGEVRLWNFARHTGQFQMTNALGGFGWNPPLFSPDGKTLALQTYATSRGELTTGMILNASSLKEIASVTGETVSFSPDSRQMVTMVYGKVGQFRVWTMSNFSNRAGIWVDAERMEGHPNFSRDGCFAGIGFYTKTGEAEYSFRPGLLNAGTGEKICEIPGDAAWVPPSYFLPDGRTWAYAMGSKIGLFDLPARTNRLTLESHSGIAFMAISPDGKTLAASHANDLISLWDLNSGKRLGTLAGHQGHVLSLAFSSDGRTLASGSEDRTIKLWHLATQRELASFTEEKGVYGLTFSPDNQMLISGGMGFYHFWRAPRGGAEVIPLVPKLSMADLPTNSIWRAPDGADQMSPRMASEQNQCFTNMSKIYSAIMAYRKDNLQMPDCLSDLVPKYLSDTNCLICPVCRRTGKAPDLAGMNDPKLASSYFYEFDAHTNKWTDDYGVAVPGDTMKTWKERQLLRYGTIVPVMRCQMHAHYLSVTFAGQTQVNEGKWEMAVEQAMKLKQGAATNAVRSPP